MTAEYSDVLLEIVDRLHNINIALQQIATALVAMEQNRLVLDRGMKIDESED